MKSSLPIFIISLPEQKSRRDRLAKQLNVMGLSYTMTDAVDGRLLNLDNLYPPLDMAEHRRLWGGDMSRPEIGCFLSHYNLWQHIINNNLPYALIMEDDAVIDHDMPAILEMILNSTWHWDITRLSAFTVTNRLIRKGYNLSTIDQANKKAMFKLVSKKVSSMGNRYLVRHNQNVIDTAAYVITQSAALKLIKHYKCISEPVDFMYDLSWQHGLYFLSIIPPVVRQLRQVQTADEIEPSAIEIYRTKRQQASKSSYKAIIAIAWHKTKRRIKQRLWNLRNPLKKRS